MSRIDGIRLKIERAKQHIRELDAAIRSFGDSEPYTLALKHKPEIHHVALYVSSMQPIPQSIAPIIGDAIHNFRSAFDHLAWQLVEVGGGIPNKDTFFPICQTPQQYSSAIGKGEIRKIPMGAKKILSDIQPNNGGDQTIWHIHELDRIDKHRLLITTEVGFPKWRIVIDKIRGLEIGWDEPRPVPLVVGYEVVNVPTDTYHRTGHENFKLSVDVAFGQSEIVPGKPVLETLNHMADFVDGIVRQLEPFLI
jgi:hypothetical protein